VCVCHDILLAFRFATGVHLYFARSLPVTSAL
jgi:hypothetical protein